MAELHFLKGNAAYPETGGNKCIVHICNDIGAWGSGFVMAISERWDEPEATYRRIAKSRPEELTLGNYQLVLVEDDIIVANMIAQHGIRTRKNRNAPAPIRYDALRECLRKVAGNLAAWRDSSIHMPRIGCGRAGGKWEKVEPIIKDELIDKGFDVYVYDFDEKAEPFSKRK